MQYYFYTDHLEMNTFSVKNDHLSCVVTITGDKVRASGSITVPSAFTRMIIVAPNAIDRRMSYSGSGLPFPCPNMAFDNTPNKVIVDSSGAFDVSFAYPNSYYTNDAFRKVEPSIFFILQQGAGVDPVFVRVSLEDVIPLRSLTHRPERAADKVAFYGAKESLIVPQTAEGVMRTLKTYKSKYGIA
jgi:hypothetical protein